MTNHNQRYSNSKEDQEDEYSDSFEDDDEEHTANGNPSPKQAWAEKTNKLPAEHSDSEGEESDYDEKPNHTNLNGKGLKKNTSALSLKSISNKSSSLSLSADSVRGLDAFAARKKRSNSVDSIERLKKDADLLSPRPTTERETNIQNAMNEYLKRKTKQRWERVKEVYIDTSGNKTSERRTYEEPEQMWEKIDALKRMVNDLTQEKTVLKTKLQRQEVELKRRDTKLEELMQINIGTVKNSTVAKWMKESAMNEQLRIRVKNLENTMEEKDKQILKLKNRVRKTRVDQLEELVSELYRENQRFKNFASETRVQDTVKHKEYVDKLEADHKSALQKIVTLKSQIVKKTTQNTQLAEASQSQEQQIASLKTQLEDVLVRGNIAEGARQQIKSLEKQLAELKQKHEQVQEENSFLKAEVENLKSRLAILEAENESMKEELSRINKEDFERLKKEEAERRKKAAAEEAEKKRKEEERQRKLEEEKAKKKQDQAASKIQAGYRGHTVRKQYKKTKDEVRKQKEKEERIRREEEERRQKEEHEKIQAQIKQEVRVKSAKKIQTKYRGYQQRSKYSKTRDAIIRIQCWVRGWKIRKQKLVDKLREELQAKLLLEQQRQSAILIQKVFRGYWKRKQFIPLRWRATPLREKAATMIQSYIRRWKAVKEFQKRYPLFPYDSTEFEFIPSGLEYEEDEVFDYI